MRACLRQLSEQSLRLLIKDGARGLNHSAKSATLTAASVAPSHSYAISYKPEALELIRLEPEKASGRLELSYLWLRDHCTCDACYNHATNQRRVQPLHLPNPDTCPTKARVEGETLKLRWPDHHLSSYDMTWLSKVWAPRELPTRQRDTGMEHSPLTWTGRELKAAGGPQSHSYQQVMGEEAELRAVLKDILVTGMALVEGSSPTDPAQTRALCERVGLIEETLYGSFWVIDPTKVTTDTSHADTAYTHEGIGPHTDSTYYRNTPGVQCIRHEKRFEVFHIMKTAEGGENVFVDGFKAIQKLQETDYQAFRFLSTTRIKHHYLEPGVHLECDEPVITVNPQTGEFVQLRYNPYDRAPLDNLNAKQTKEFYASYKVLEEIIGSSEVEYRVKLEPGQVLFVDNWRCLHGRTAFTGDRILSGCYLSRDDFLSKCRAMNL